MHAVQTKSRIPRADVASDSNWPAAAFAADGALPTRPQTCNVFRSRLRRQQQPIHLLGRYTPGLALVREVTSPPQFHNARAVIGDSKKRLRMLRIRRFRKAEDSQRNLVG